MMRTRAQTSRDAALRRLTRVNRRSRSPPWSARRCHRCRRQHALRPRAHDHPNARASGSGQSELLTSPQTSPTTRRARQPASSGRPPRTAAPRTADGNDTAQPRHRQRRSTPAATTTPAATQRRPRRTVRCSRRSWRSPGAAEPMPLPRSAPSSTAYWYLTRATGVVALVLLTLVVALGVADVARFSSPYWPRFVTDGVHRRVSLLALVFLAIHILTSVLDTYAPISLLDAVIPFHSSYRPLWLGLGAAAFDLLLAVIITSLLRARVSGAATGAPCIGLRTRAGRWRSSTASAPAPTSRRPGCSLLDAICVRRDRRRLAARAHRGVRDGLRACAAVGLPVAFVLGLAVWLPGGPLAARLGAACGHAGQLIAGDRAKPRPAGPVAGDPRSRTVPAPAGRNAVGRRARAEGARVAARPAAAAAAARAALGPSADPRARAGRPARVRRRRLPDRDEAARGRRPGRTCPRGRQRRARASRSAARTCC